jgi:WS/DGAT/MGAT family acyltransferase
MLSPKTALKTPRQKPSNPRVKIRRKVFPSERMSPVDRAWLRMDSPANLMMILGVWIIKPGVGFAAVTQRLEERLLLHSRFGQRVEEDALGARWVPDEDFRIERHVVLEHLARSAKGQEQQALQDRLAELAVQPLDKAHPLWQFHLVEHYQGGSALMARIHHCIADGVALIGVTQSMVDGGSVPQAAVADAGDEVGLKDLGDLISGLWSEPKKGLEVLLEKGLAGSADLAKQAYQAVQDASALAFMPDDSATRLKGTPGLRKRVAWCEPLPLEEVKAVAHALNCSINDLLMSCVAGAFSAYLLACGDETADKEFRAMVPVNLRTAADVGKMGNRFGLAPLLLPLGVENPIERVYEVRRRMSAMKGSFQPLLTLGLLAAAGLLVKPGQDALLELFSKKTTAVLTNVPGPHEKLKFLGATLEQDLVWVPQSGTVGLGVSVLSYGGGVQFGLISDADLCPQPQAIVENFAHEFAKLSLLVLMLPWEA